MKKIAALTFIFLFIAIVVVYLIPARPIIIVQNATKERVYLRAAESTYGVESTPEEVDKIMREPFDVIEPGEMLTITYSLSSIILGAGELNIGWSTGGQFEYNSTGAGGQNFHLSSKSSFCSAVLTISPGYNNFEINDKVDGICLKKLSVIKEKY